MVCELDRLHFYKQTSQLGSKNSMTDLEIKTEEKLYIVSIAKVAFQLITLLFETYNVVQSMLSNNFFIFFNTPCLFLLPFTTLMFYPNPFDKTRDLKGLRVDSPCNNLFQTAIGI